MIPAAPRYGSGALADLAGSLLARLGLPGAEDVLGLPETQKVCLLLVDGLGWELLREHRDRAPFLASLSADRGPLTAGFPSTTATSISSIGTGRPSGEHGIVGYSFAVGDGSVLNALNWSEDVVPERLQPEPSLFERAAEAGIGAHVVSPAELEGSGLTRAVLRGARFHGVHALGDLVSASHAALREPGPQYCYAYHADLDKLGHLYGPGSDPWCHQLVHVDRLAAALAEGLPTGGLLAVTADHGMIEAGERVEYEHTPELAEGVRTLAGEPRMRHLYPEEGAAEQVYATWRELLGDRAWVVRREEAIEAGWFGPRVAGHVRPRIGAVLAAARGNTIVTRSETELMSRFPGQHGSLTSAELDVPLLLARG
ncbi:alkaline phosphatase family protein [Sciscionella sediminilitoris]|uniref:alkaline phosphatase family protein n=1 Tax=Sciscionella sediminilitoris TaxID=1445613 RepID=UPI0004DF4B22|nr:nucleotide pyrophosphatase/phosphodiesterase family protein [Sciscionella sp. SE31]